MECPRCGAEFANSSQCLNCGIDFNIYIKAKSTSIKLYNKGLEQANNRDFSAAIQSLNKSVKFDKKNYSARNVLGLIYFEIGEIGKALKEWVISNSLVKENNLAKEYIDNIQNSARKLEKYNNAIKMYNQALIYAKQNSEDMAIIQLKKSLELNPNFIESYNLLALCYINIKENDKAISCIEKALEIDITNPKALKYYIELKQSIQRPLKIDKTVKTVSSPKYSPNSQIEKKINIKNHAFGEITGFIVGAITIAIVTYVLIMPSVKLDLQTEIQQLSDKNQAIEKQLKDSISENNATITKLEEDNKSLEANNQSLNQQIQLKEQIQQVQQISTLYNNGNKEEATTLLLLLTDSIENFPEETKTLYNSLKDSILPDMAKIYYNDGMKAYNTKKYDEARVLFEKSISMSGEQTFSGEVLYFTARIDEINGNIDNAKLLYQTVIDKHPNSNQFWNSKNRLARLN